MSRYIDADKLQETYKELHDGKRSLLIDTEPTAADVVEVVRCKDCIKRRNGCPMQVWCGPNDDDYCSRGEAGDV